MSCRPNPRRRALLGFLFSLKDNPCQSRAIWLVQSKFWPPVGFSEDATQILRLAGFSFSFSFQKFFFSSFIALMINEYNLAEGSSHQSSHGKTPYFFIMNRIFAIASSLLVLFITTSTAFVVDSGNKAAVIPTIQLDIDLGHAKNSNYACCPDYPYCSCPKLDAKATTYSTISTKRTKIRNIKLPPVGAMQSSNNYECCASYPYCGCPKLDAPVTAQRIQANSNSCCPDFPYCGCPKLEVETRFEAASQGRRIVMPPCVTRQ